MKLFRTQIKTTKQFLRKSYSTKVNIYVNGKREQVDAGQTIFEACSKILPKNRQIPTICHHPYLKPTGVCRICLIQQGPPMKDTSAEFIELPKDTWMKPSCTTPVSEGLTVWTDTPQVRENVRDVLSFMLAGHPLECPTCAVNANCEFQDLLAKYNVSVNDLDPVALDKLQKHQMEATLRKLREDVDSALSKFEQFGSHAIKLDRDKCIKCTRCIRACSELQGMNILGLEGRGRDLKVSCFAPNENFSSTECISCGQCSYVCPVGAITAQSYVKEVRDLLKGYTTDEKGQRYVVVAQTAPAVRVALSEGFNLEPGTLTDQQMSAALRAVGFDYVFDTNFTADLTIIEEGNELLQRLKTNGPFPMFTSCCPAWINLVEKKYPEFIPNLSSCKSPQAMMGALIKKYWAEKLKIPKDRIKVVSFMPCCAKKDEARREQLDDDVDYVLSTREMISLIKAEKINAVNLEGKPFDDPLGASTGAAVIFGATGGVMEAALRTAYEVATGKTLPKVDFMECRGMTGIKEATIDIDGTKLRIAVAHTTGKAQELLERIKKGDEKFDFIEVMACNGGCVGGGGEPKVNPRNADALAKRLDSIYARDEANVLRKSHENPSVIQLYKEYLKEPLGHKSHELLHTHYRNRKVL